MAFTIHNEQKLKKKVRKRLNHSGYSSPCLIKPSFKKALTA